MEPRGLNGTASNAGQALGVLLHLMTPDDLIATARAVGIDWIWDHMIAPVIEQERAAADETSACEGEDAAFIDAELERPYEDDGARDG